MLTIAITGRVATGKSTVANLLAQNKYRIVDADKIAHLTYINGGTAYPKLVSIFGSGILDNQGQIERSKLAKIAFESTSNWEKLNSIVWPRTRVLIEEKLADMATTGCTHAALEAAELLRAGWHNLADTIWVVDGPARRAGTEIFESRQMGTAELIQAAEDCGRPYRVLPNLSKLDDLKQLVLKLLKEVNHNY